MTLTYSDNQSPEIFHISVMPLKVSKFRKQIMVSKLFSKKQTKLTTLEDYYLKVNTKREPMFFLQEDRLSFVLTLK